MLIVWLESNVEYIELIFSILIAIFRVKTTEKKNYNYKKSFAVIYSFSK